MKQIKHWQDAVNVVLGAWLFVSPWAVGYSDESAALYNALVVGALLIAAALGAIFTPKAWEEWTEAALGVWLVVSPWLLGFRGDRGALLTAAFTGVLVLVLSLWTLATDKDYGWAGHDAV